ncbi:hypothetical protein HUT16_27380 [Kitasatospora sp. NA04385]|uniref:hypothetical protein n=1 Tax=Kitasatospora sp. NA04385 TaxID=2742135 RepID=UPI00158FCD92|nr:hypothetical protein [Kitasatospora sp. NA04385]QKW22303.1 hypothetical protein HUT16_27380 [Kitasatospora sp. NA04385]
MQQSLIERARALASAQVFGPGLAPCRCGAPRHVHQGRKSLGSHSATNCARYRRDPADVLLERAQAAANNRLGQDLAQSDRPRRRRRPRRPKKPGEWSIGASDTGSCRRAIWYRENPPPGYVPAPVDRRAALAGTLIHDSISRRRRALYPWRLQEQSVTLPGLDRPSRYDEYDPVTGVLYDYKTAGDWKWAVVGESGPPETEWDQGQLYALALHLAGQLVVEVRIVYYERKSGADEEFSRPFDEQAARRALGRLTAIATALDLGTALPRDRSGPSTDVICRRYCGARIDCWSINQAEAAGRSPESYTLVTDADDIEWALGEYDRTRAEKSKAEKAQNVAKALLDGIPPATYGEFEYVHTGGRLKDPEPDPAARLRQLEGLWDLPETERPALAELDYPTKRTRTTSRMEVRRVRAAVRARRATPGRG